MAAFEYPSPSTERVHGPQGYADHNSYRPWLRDEFSFRCIYCLSREQWGRVTGSFDLDHFLPQATHPHLEPAYDNLVYACHTCNMLKGDRLLPDPSRVLTSGQVRVNPDGSIDGLTDDARRLILILGLDSPTYRRWRLLWIRNIELADAYDRPQYQRLMGLPDDLPDLARLRPPGGNTRPQGIQNSWYAKRQRGEAPVTY